MKKMLLRRGAAQQRALEPAANINQLVLWSLAQEKDAAERVHVGGAWW
jgi:hypothetical protein